MIGIINMTNNYLYIIDERYYARMPYAHAKNSNLWNLPEHALAYLEQADAIPHRAEGEAALLEFLPRVNRVLDLGSGDGRLVITAAKEYGARGVGIDISPERIYEANENAKAAKVTDKVKFIEGDLFKQNFSEATVVTIYLLPDVNLRLRPMLFEQLKPGTRIVSHAFDMGDWKPERTESVDGRTIYFWRIPEKAKTAGK